MPLLPNPKHEKIVQAFVRGAGQLEAYTSVGFRPHAPVASAFFKRPEVKARIAEVRELKSRLLVEREIETSADAARKLGITKAKILEALWVNARNCLHGQAVVGKDGKPTGEYTGTPVNAAAGNQALKLIGMECHGMFVERLEVGGPGDFARLTDEELAARVEADAAALGVDAEVTEALMLTFQPSSAEG